MGKGILKKTGNIIVDIIIVLLIIIVAFTVYTNVQYSKNPESIPMPLGFNVLTVLTGSMQPYLMPGDRILIQKVVENDIHKEDIISFYKSSGMLVTHRVSDIVENNGNKHYVTKGDFNNSIDIENITGSQIVGKLAFKLTPINLMNRSIKNGTWIYYLLLIVVLIGIILVSSKLIKKENVR